MKTIALFINHPECSKDCCEGMIKALSNSYIITLFSFDECSTINLESYDMVAFPGGIGDASSYDRFFRRKIQNKVADYITNGGRYLGICMGAYWAGSYYFDILDEVEPVQYIKRPTSDIKKSYGTVAPVLWNNNNENMFFYDGCAMIGNSDKFTTISTYANGDPMAIIQNRIGLIGCHLESQEYWYQKPWQYINKHWHQEKHHQLLLEFVDLLMQR